MKLVDRIERTIPAFNGLHELDSLFDTVMGNCRKGECMFTPRTDIVEDATGFNLSLELPGVEAADVSVEVADERLIVTGEKKSVSTTESCTIHRRERIAGKFQRMFVFPTHVDFEKIEAAFNSGILEIRVPKAEKVLPRKIEIAVKPNA